MPPGRAPLSGRPADAAVQAGPGAEEGALCRKVLRDVRVARLEAGQDLKTGAVISSICPQKKVNTSYNHIMNILLRNQKSEEMNSFYCYLLIDEILRPAVAWNGILLRFHE